MTIQSRHPALKLIYLLSIWCFLVFASSSHAHSTNQSIMKLNESQGLLTGEWSIPLKFLDMVLDLDADQNQRITWEEVLLAQPRIENHLRQAVSFNQEASSTASCAISIGGFMLQNLREGLALFVPFSVSCPQAISSSNLANIDYQLFFNEDPWHRGFISYQTADIEQQWIASPNNHYFVLSDEKPSILSLAWQFIIEGVWHIWIGLDHILFLIALLFPAVFFYQNKPDGSALKQSVHNRFMPMFMDTLKIVTAFTVSHSVTLALAAFEIVTLPAVMIEIVIAASVVFSALLIWLPAWQRFRWQLAFAFGFIHGFGFANVLGDLTLPQESFALCLFAFNVGVELGQLAIVAVVLPLMFSLRNQKLYTQMGIPFAMTLIALVGVYWIIERSMG